MVDISASSSRIGSLDGADQSFRFDKAKGV